MFSSVVMESTALHGGWQEFGEIDAAALVGWLTTVRETFWLVPESLVRLIRVLTDSFFIMVLLEGEIEIEKSAKESGSIVRSYVAVLVKLPAVAESVIG